MLKLKQLLPAYFLKLIFDKIQVIWIFQSTTITAKLPSEDFFYVFFAFNIFLLLKRKSLLHCYKVNVTKVTLLIRFELIGAHSHSTYANMSNILTSRPPLVCMYMFYRPPSPIPLFHRIFLSF